jgi:hypothetical protein
VNKLSNCVMCAIRLCMDWSAALPSRRRSTSSHSLRDRRVCGAHRRIRLLYDS